MVPLGVLRPLQKWLENRRYEGSVLFSVMSLRANPCLLCQALVPLANLEAPLRSTGVAPSTLWHSAAYPVIRPDA